MVMIVMNMREEVSIQNSSSAAAVAAEEDSLVRKKAYLVGYSPPSTEPIVDDTVVAEPQGDNNYAAVVSREL